MVAPPSGSIYIWRCGRVHIGQVIVSIAQLSLPDLFDPPQLCAAKLTIVRANAPVVIRPEVAEDPSPPIGGPF